MKAITLAIKVFLCKLGTFLAKNCKTIVKSLVLQAIGHVSGGHVNPAVTAGMAATGKIKPVRGVLYVIAQCAGAAAGSGLLKAFTPDPVAGNLGITGLGKDVTQLQGFGIEFFLGFVLVFVVCGVSVKSKFYVHTYMRKNSITFTKVDYLRQHPGQNLELPRLYRTLLLNNTVLM